MDSIHVKHVRKKERRASIGSLSLFLGRISSPLSPRRSEDDLSPRFQKAKRTLSGSSPLSPRESKLKKAKRSNSTSPRLKASKKYKSPRSLSNLIRSPREKKKDKEKDYIENVCCPSIVELMNKGYMKFKKEDTTIIASCNKNFIIVKLDQLESGGFKLRNITIGGVKYILDADIHRIARTAFCVINSQERNFKAHNASVRRDPSMSRIDQTDNEFAMDLGNCKMKIKENAVRYYAKDVILNPPVNQRSWGLSDNYKYGLLKFLLINREEMKIIIKYNVIENIIEAFRESTSLFTIEGCIEIIHLYMACWICDYDYDMFLRILYFM